MFFLFWLRPVWFEMGAAGTDDNPVHAKVSQLKQDTDPLQVNYLNVSDI